MGAFQSRDRREELPLLPVRLSKLPVRCRPSFSRNATPHRKALNVGFRQEPTLNFRHRNDGFVPESIIPQLLVKRSTGYERMSDVGEGARTLKRRIVGRRGEGEGGSSRPTQTCRLAILTPDNDLSLSAIFPASPSPTGHFGKGQSGTDLGIASDPHDRWRGRRGGGPATGSISRTPALS